MTPAFWNYVSGIDTEQASLALQYYKALRYLASRGQSTFLGRQAHNPDYFLASVVAWTDGGKVTTSKVDWLTVDKRMMLTTSEFVCDKSETILKTFEHVDFGNVEEAEKARPLLLIMFRNWYADKLRKNNNKYRKAIEAALGWMECDTIQVHETRGHYLNQELTDIAAALHQENDMSYQDKLDALYTELKKCSDDDIAIVFNEMGTENIVVEGRKYALPSGTVSNATYAKRRAILLETLRTTIGSKNV